MISAGIWWSPSEQTTKFRSVIAFEVQEYQVELVANLGICFAFFFFSQNLSKHLWWETDV